MSGFGSSSTSGFGSLKSGFAGVGGGFAAAAKSGGLTNFASPNAPATLGGEPKPAKPIGADESGDEGSDNDEGEETSTFEADKTDERFYEQTSSSFLPDTLQSVIYTNIKTQSRLVRKKKRISSPARASYSTLAAASGKSAAWGLSRSTPARAMTESNMVV